LNHRLLADYVTELHGAKIGFAEKKKAEAMSFCFFIIVENNL